MSCLNSTHAKVKSKTFYCANLPKDTVNVKINPQTLSVSTLIPIMLDVDVILARKYVMTWDNFSYDWVQIFYD